MIETFNPIFLLFTSYALGALGTVFLKFMGIFGRFENHNYIGDKLTKRLGVLILGWLIRKSFLGSFNQKLTFKGGFNQEKLVQLKKEMTFAENSHLLGFFLLQLWIGMLAIWEIELWQLIAYTLCNIVFNLYLVFLQQYNKRRIDRILNLQEARVKSP